MQNSNIHAIQQLRQTIRDKASRHEVHAIIGHVDSLERTLQELSSEVIGLRNELQTVQEAMSSVRETIQDLSNGRHFG